MATQLKGDTIAQMQPYPTKVTDQAVITFDTDNAWGDGNDWWHKLTRHDFQTVSLHELGHAFSLDHDKDSSLMKKKLSTFEMQRTIPTHDLNAVKENFK